MKVLIYYAIAALVVIADQGSKWLVVHKMHLYQTISVFGSFFEITSIRNRGAAFSILQNQRIFFILVTLVVIGGVIWFLHKTVPSGRRLIPVALGLLLGGALGNFIDRAFFGGRVVDFLQFDFHPIGIHYTFAVFNIADSAITIGVVLIFIDQIFGSRTQQKGQSN